MSELTMDLSDYGIDEQLSEASGSLIVVMYRLPIIAERVEGSKEWDFTFDNDALYMTFEGLNESLQEKGKKVTWVGVLNLDEEIEEDEQRLISKQLWDRFRCAPVWIPRRTIELFYKGFCKGVLWPVFHMVNYIPDGGESTYDEALWHVYMIVNRKFKEAIVGRFHEGVDSIWIHDYHLMLLPSMLRRDLDRCRIGFFLHTPWPSSEMYRNLPWRVQLLEGMLGSSILGFHLFDYARHFLSACVRLLDLEQKLTRGALTVEHHGRIITLRVSHIGIHPERFQRNRENEEVNRLCKAMAQQYQVMDKCVFGAIDDLDIIKGITLKLLAFEEFLRAYPVLRSKVKLVQFVVPRPSAVKKGIREEIESHVNRINEKYSTPENKPVEYRAGAVSFNERIALYRLTDVLTLTPIRDGLNLVPYEYILSSGKTQPGRMILSECTGCSRALSLTVRVNPFDKRTVADVMKLFVTACEADKESQTQTDDKLRQKANISYVTEHSTRDWAESFLRDVEKVYEPSRPVPKIGLGRMIQPLFEFEGFDHLEIDTIYSAYKESQRRLFLMDYDGTLEATGSNEQVKAWSSPPSERVLMTLSKLSSNPKDVVCILSGRSRSTMEEKFSSLKEVGLAAEHGFYYRLPGSTEWHLQMASADSSWKEPAREIMGAYTERTDGSFLEEKESALVWHYKKADPEFGRSQAKEMHENLDSVLNVFDVEVLSGYGWLQVRLQGVSKKNMVKKFVSEQYKDTEQPDFIFCAGDDVTDEDMFSVVSSYKHARIFTCVVGMKPSAARYYLRNNEEVTSETGSPSRLLLYVN
uniref:Alpha,alpha-trehalose-phosphate synthase (UDP-forming) n=2 Tax=Rhodosorus marinus TaxID=101924 RepID=A0A7S2ZXJ3_9RHOD|mmetsp:Transcript_35415/g.140788  ORF Transcript_35415/g.140788 Transcript_35415/m.140788 type:complete len:808 (+) Transcript_35415:75-2498(+)